MEKTITTLDVLQRAKMMGEDWDRAMESLDTALDEINPDRVDNPIDFDVEEVPRAIARNFLAGTLETLEAEGKLSPEEVEKEHLDLNIGWLFYELGVDVDETTPNCEINGERMFLFDSERFDECERPICYLAHKDEESGLWDKLFQASYNLPEFGKEVDETTLAWDDVLGAIDWDKPERMSDISDEYNWCVF